MKLQKNASKPASDDDACLFCKIIARDTEASILFEDDMSMAFLDSRPLFPGHCLLVPKAHYETLAEIPEKLIGPLFLNAQRLSTVVQNAMNSEGTFVAMNNVVSQSVPHFHIHIVPRRRKDGLRGFFWPRHKYETEAEQSSVRNKLIAEIENEIGSAKSLGGTRS